MNQSDKDVLKRAADYLRLSKSKVESHYKNSTRVDPRYKALANELTYLESCGLIPSNNELDNLLDIDKERESLLKTLHAYEKDKLLKELIETKIELSLEIEESKRLNKIIKFLRNFFDESQKNDLTNARKISKGVGKRSYPNKEALYECLNELYVQIQRDFEVSDYPRFKEIVFKRYPKPPKPKRPRLTATEKTYSPELIEEELEIKAETGWAESSLRKFFEDSTGLKIKKLKK